MKAFAIMRAHQVKIATVLFATVFVILFLAPSMFVYIYPGQAGVLFDSLSGKPLAGTVYGEGLYTIAPWNRMYIYDMTTQRRTMETGALASNGLQVNLTVSVIFQPDSERLSTLVTQFGPEYTDKIVVPTIHSAMRYVIGSQTPEALYTTAMDDLHERVLTQARERFTGLPFQIKDVIIEKLQLPDSINTAIEAKLKVQQDALAYEFVLAKQRGEAKRMEIEAEAIKRYQGIVGSNLSPELLQWLQIRALHDLAGSENSKIIVIGDSGKLPLVLDGGN